ncbi:hypothetical protein Ccrd_026137, partial [Cynara cardunculus var. scolymus]
MSLGGDGQMNDLIWYSWVGGIIIGSNMVLDEVSRVGPRDVVIIGRYLSFCFFVLFHEHVEFADMTIKELVENLQEDLLTTTTSTVSLESTFSLSGGFESGCRLHPNQLRVLKGEIDLLLKIEEETEEDSMEGEITGNQKQRKSPVTRKEENR